MQVSSRIQLVASWILFSVWLIASALISKSVVELLRASTGYTSESTSTRGVLMLVAVLTYAAALIAVYFIGNWVASAWFRTRSLKDWFLALNEPLWRGEGWWRR